MKDVSRTATAKKDRRKVNRGEPGQNIVTPFEGGQPTCENPPLALASPSSVSVPSLIPEEIHHEPAGLSRNDEIGHFRASLVLAFRQEASKRTGSKKNFVNQFVKKFNSGGLFPDIYNGLFPESRKRAKAKFISPRTLYRWIEDFGDGDIRSLTPQYGGVGTSKVTDYEKNVLLALCLHQNRLKVAQAITLAKEWLKSRKIESPSSPATLRRFADQFKKEHYDLWTLRREGEKALKDKVMPYAERDWRVLEVGEGLVADGHRLNFQVVHPVTGKPYRAALVLFWDWRSSYPLGWEIMLEEDIQCVASALRNSILTLGKIPKWVYLDNGRAFRAKIFTEDLNFEDGELPGMFARLNINYHFAQPYNAQSKPIERIFGILNDQLERLIPSYIGASIDDKPPWTRRNEKYARSLHDPYVPTIPEASELIRAWRDRYAEQPSRGRGGLRPIDIFNEGKGDGVDPAGLIYLMMHQEIKTVHRNGITWLGWHWYDENLYGLKDKVVIRYSLSDLSQIYILHKNEFLCTAKPVNQLHPQASESGNPKDMEAVKDVLRLKKKVKNATRKLCGLLETKEASQIDWSRTRQPEIREAIQKIEEAKEPRLINCSPFPDEPDEKLVLPEESCVAPPEEDKIDVTADPDSALSCAWFGSQWEMYEWYYKRDPAAHNIADLGQIDWLEDGYFGRHYGSGSSQRHFKYLLSQRPGEAEYDAENEEDGRDYRLGRDPAIEERWREIKNGITIDSISGLSSPAGGLPGDNEELRYRFYRGIENRFPGTLTDSDWGEVKKYQGTRDWERMHHEMEIPRLTRALNE